MEMLKLPNRTKKFREYGITSVTDFGVPIGELKNILEDYAQFIDFAKLGVGTAYITPNVKDKINLYKEYDIIPYCGGTLFEKAYLQNKIDDYLLYLKRLDVEWVEISTGVLAIPIEERIRFVERINRDFYVIGEVGSKELEKNNEIDWVMEMNALIDAGCQYVTAEGRDSGTAGIYQKNGNVNKEILADIFSHVDHAKIIFEAPNAKSQMFFINLFGPNVNLGNVNIRDVLLLETQRNCLRAETFFLEESKWTLQL